MKTEIWKAHPKYTGIEVSTLGRVRTLDKMVSNGRGTWIVKGRVLKQDKCKNGYLQVQVKANGKFIKQRIHRLVAQTFLTNPDNFPEVNHKDNDRTNNNVNNLEWCTRSYNRQYREKYGEAKGKPILAANLSTLEVSRFRSQNEAGIVLGVNVGNINSVIKGRRKTAGGFWFTNADDNADDAINRKLYEIGKTGLNIR